METSPMAPVKKAPRKKSKTTTLEPSKQFQGLLIAVAVLVVVIIGIVIWSSSVSRKLSNVEKTLTGVTEGYQKSGTEFEQMFQEQKQAIENIAAKAQEEFKGKITLQEYKNDALGFSVQYPSDWQSAAEIFDASHPITFTPTDAKDAKQAIGLQLLEADTFAKAVGISTMVKEEGLKQKSSAAITVRGVEGKMVVFENKNKDQFAYYYFPLNGKMLEFSLNTDDKAYTSVFETLVASLKIEIKAPEVTENNPAPEATPPAPSEVPTPETQTAETNP